MSLASDVAITFVGLTPNPVAVGSAYLAQVGADTVAYEWSDWASSTWASVAGMEWGA